MTQQQSNDLTNAGGSSVLGLIASWLMTYALPWAAHTVGAIATGLLTAYVVFHFNRYMKRKG